MLLACEPQSRPNSKLSRRRLFVRTADAVLVED
jgi:hypothetical protein